MTHTTTIVFNPSADRWEWRCTCGAWGRSLLYDEAWIRDRARNHEKVHHA